MTMPDSIDTTQYRGSTLRRSSSEKDVVTPTYNPPRRSTSANSLWKQDNSSNHLTLDDTVHSRNDLDEGGRSVTFGTIKCKRVGLMPAECHPQVYYKGAELEDLLQQEVDQIQRAKHKAMRYSKKSSTNFETEVMTLRGMEDLMDSTDKSRKISYHVAQVVKESARQTKAGRPDVQAIKVISRRISRPDKQKALKRGKEDAKAVGHHETAMPRVSSAPTLALNEEDTPNFNRQASMKRASMKRAISKHNMKKTLGTIGPSPMEQGKMAKRSSFTSLAKTLRMSLSATNKTVSSPAC